MSINRGPSIIVEASVLPSCRVFTMFIADSHSSTVEVGVKFMFVMHLASVALVFLIFFAVWDSPILNKRIGTTCPSVCLPCH